MSPPWRSMRDSAAAAGSRCSAAAGGCNAGEAEVMGSVLHALAATEQDVEEDDEPDYDEEPHDRDGRRIAEVEGVPVEGPLVHVGRHGLGRPYRAALGHDPDQVEDLHLPDEGEDVEVEQGGPEH